MALTISINQAASFTVDINVPGPQGPVGPAGPAGPQGLIGPQGIQGEQGNHGIQGVQGIQGIQGVKGDKGDEGQAGIQGPIGATGSQGPQGIAGENGATGPQGPQGEIGPIGPTGPQGIQGIQGINGDKYATTSTTSLSVSNGIKTLTVATGLAYTTQQSVVVAYDAAHHMHGDVLSYNAVSGVMVVDINKNTGAGTYAAWSVNLEGAAGIQGPQGIQGVAGETGPAGPTGPQGPTGATGATGATGPQGDAGATGPQGPQGDQGVQGIQGIEGPQGIQGEQGVPGPEGDAGAQGVAGVGVPVGGSSGQVLAKINGTDYNTEWITPSSGGGVPEAPQDNFVYGRMNANWVRVPGVAAFTQIATGVNSIASWSVTGGSVLLSGSGTVVTDNAASLTALTCYGNSGASLDVTGMSGLNTLYCDSWSSVTSLPSSLLTANFQNCTFTTAPSITSQLSSYTLANSSVVAAPNLNSQASLTSAAIYNNSQMTGTPDFYGCTTLSTVVLSGNVLMAGGPDFSAAAGSPINSFNSQGCTSMATPPVFSSYSQIYSVDVSNCAIADCDSLGMFLASNASSYGTYNGFLNVSGGTNQSFDSMSPPSWINALQTQNWTVIYNSF